MALNRITRGVRAQVGGGALEKRVAELESEVQECRELNLRVAELTDLVVDLLVPLADSDDPRVTEVLQRYRIGVTSAAADPGT